MASAQPAISSAVSPLIRIATRNAPIWTDVASPLMIWSITARASERREVATVHEASRGPLDHRLPQEAPADVGPERGQNRLGMELDAVDRVLAVPDGHHLAVVGGRAHLE